MANKYLIGFLVLVILSASIYVMLPDNVRIDVENTRTKYSVWEDNGFKLAATEYVNLFDGTTKMRAKSRSISQITSGDNIILSRVSNWKDNITTIQTYTFDSSLKDVELVPVKNEFECFNCEGKIIHYEFRDIIYEGETKNINSPFSELGLRMKLEWDELNNDYSWAKVYQSKYASDKIVIRYKADEDYEKYDVRMFDPPPSGYSPKLSFAPEENFGVDNLSEAIYYWKFDENNTDNIYLDYFENKNLTMQNNNTDMWVAGVVNSGIFWDQALDMRIETGFSSSIFSPYEGTINFWGHPGSTQQCGYWSTQYALSDNAANEISVEPRYGTYYYQWGGNSKQIVPNTFTVSATNMITLTFNSTNQRFYSNGVLRHESNGSFSANAGNNFVIGQDYSDFCSRRWNNLMDEFSIWGRQLTDDEILALYTLYGEDSQLGTAYYASRVSAKIPQNDFSAELSPNIFANWRLDESSGTLSEDQTGLYNLTATNESVFGTGWIGNGAVTGTETLSTNSICKASNFYGGSNTYLQYKSYSINMWVYINDSTNGNFFVCRPNFSDWSFLTLSYSNETEKLSMYRYGCGTTVSDNTISPGWHMITGVFANDQYLRLYVDGVQDMNDPCSYGMAIGADTAGSLTVGGTTAIIDEITMYVPRALTGDDVSDLYNIQKTNYAPSRYPTFIGESTSSKLSLYES